MNDLLIKKATVGLRYDQNNPWVIFFDAIEDLMLPFNGTILIPDAVGPETNFTSIGHEDFLHLSLRYPQTGTGGARRFQNLRDMNNRPVETLHTPIFLIENDPSFLDDFHLSGSDNLYDPVVKDNMEMPNRCKFIMIEFSSSFPMALPLTLKPFTADRGLALKDNTLPDEGMAALKDALQAAGAMSGSIKVFDISGRQTEAYSGLLTLGIKRNEVDNAPALDHKVSIQFVNIHGDPLKLDAFPLSHFNIVFPATPVSTLNDFSIFEVQFADDTERKLKFELQTGATIEDGEQYKYFFHYLSLWPGYNFTFKEIREVEPPAKFELNLAQHILTANIPSVRFVRLCVFHPDDEFQKHPDEGIKVLSYFEPGETIQQRRAIFKNNGFHFFSANNKITPYNSGDIFFRDFYNVVSSLADGDNLMQANWDSQPITHMTGSMQVKNIEPNGLDTQSVSEQLQKTKSNFVLYRIINSAGDAQLLYMPDKINGNPFTESLTAEVWTVPGEAHFPRMTTKGFIRKQHSFAWILDVIRDAAHPENIVSYIPHRVVTYWKDLMGTVRTTAMQELYDTSNVTLAPDPGFTLDLAAFAFGIDDNDPPKLQIKRMAAQSSITPQPDPCLMIVNITAGGLYFVPLNPPGADANATNVILTDASAYPDGSDQQHTINQMLNTFSALDLLMLAITHTPTTPDAFIADLLISKIIPWTFPADAIRLGTIPLQEQELGGLFRKAIAKGVKVRALYWEQFLASLSPGFSLSSGLSNNESITSVINIHHAASGKHGFAFRDRTSREFGSWHQKCTAIVKKDQEVVINPKKLLIAYVGGMDLTLGRWDTQQHFTKDPERQSRPWYDNHVKIEGEGALDVLLNFRHRWRANGVFLTNQAYSEFAPVNTSPELEADTTITPFDPPDRGQIKIPGQDSSNAFVQITRTIPPLSSLSMPDVFAATGVTIPSATGELGSFQSYKKAFANAKKFIIINEQYFYSQEIAQLLHDRLLAPDGPEFLIMILPKVLNDSEYIDPHLFRIRQLAITTLYYGSHVADPDAPTSCGKRSPNENGPDTVKKKVAIITPVTAEGEPVYVHSKHSIVDDVWMSIGSANINGRSLTFDGEINAAIIGNALYKGGTSVVRNHRIEICRQLLGLPEAYSALLQDPYATFRLVKAIELQQTAYSLRLHPKPLASMWLDPTFVTRSGQATYDDEIEFVTRLDYTSSSFAFLTCNGLDPDGLSNAPTRLGFLASLADKGKAAPNAIAEVGFDWNASKADIQSRINASEELILTIQLTIDDHSPDTPQVGPLNVATFQLELSSDNSILLHGLPTGVVTVPISKWDRYVIDATVTTKAAPTVVLHRGNPSIVFDPPNPVVESGSVHAAIMTILPV